MKRSKIIKFMLFVTGIFLLWKFIFWARLQSRHQVSENVANGTQRGGVRVALSALLRNHSRPDFFHSPASIPQILHQTFKSEMVFENYKTFISSCLSLNPNWTYYLWRDSDAEALIAKHYPEFLSKYKKYTHRLERSDSIRYIILHHFGGIYLDMDMECRQPFFPALSRFDSFLDKERIEQSQIFWGKPYNVMNSGMGSKPGHPFFRHVINEMIAERIVGDVLNSAGPFLLTRVYNKYMASKPAVPISLLEPKFMSPLMDIKVGWNNMCHGSLSGGLKPESQRTLKERGCLMLQAKNWRMDDTDNSTVCIHRFLHLGYPNEFSAVRIKLFNATVYFWPRVHYYG